MQEQTVTRRTFVLLGTMGLAAGLFGCGGKETNSQAAGSEPSTPKTAQKTPTIGGWEVNTEEPASVLTTEQQTVFENATKEYAGLEFKPACTLGTQVVAGVNYAFLCLGMPMTSDAAPGWYVVVVYKDLQNTCEITSTKQIDVNNPATTNEAAPEDLVGGWSVAPEVFDAKTSIPGDAATAFATAGEGYEGTPLSALALMGTQVVAGTNYRFLCASKPSTPDVNSQLYVADVYKDLKGAAEYTNVDSFDLLAYV